MRLAVTLLPMWSGNETDSEDLRLEELESFDLQLEEF